MSATILHLSSSSGPGGAESVMAGLASSLDRSRYRSIACLFRDGWLRARCEQSGIETHILRLTRKLDLGWLRMFSRLVRQHGVRLIHAHEFGANTYGAIAARWLGIPLVATVHGRQYYADCATRRAAYRVLSHVATMVAVSEDVKRFVVAATGTAARRICVVHNGAAVRPPLSAAEGGRRRSALGMAPDELIVGVVGSLYGVKGHRFLLAAAPQILDARPATRFVIVGRGHLEAELKAQARQLGIADRVRFLGFRDDIGDLLPLFDVFALPSLSEGLSIALLEAMAAGTPVVATRVGGNPELVIHGETGLLVPAGDVSSLAAAISALLIDRAEATRLGENGRTRVAQSFGLDSMVEAYQAIYDRTLARSRSAA